MADNMKVYKCRSIVRGSGAGEAVVSKDAMCFYLTDPTTGVVIERNHAIEGKSIAGKVLVLQSGKGSSVVQADGFYQLWVRNNLPAAIIINVPEPVIVSSAVMVGSTMVDRLAVSYTHLDVYKRQHQSREIGRYFSGDPRRHRQRAPET